MKNEAKQKDKTEINEDITKDEVLKELVDIESKHIHATKEILQLNKKFLRDFLRIKKLSIDSLKMIDKEFKNINKTFLWLLMIIVLFELPNILNIFINLIKIVYNFWQSLSENWRISLLNNIIGFFLGVGSTIAAWWIIEKIKKRKN
jgi:hypothetical protein